MKALLLLTLLFVAGIGFSQDYDNEVPYMFEIGEDYYLLGDSVNIRKSASTKAETVTQLRLGTKVTIVSQSKAITRLNNYNMYWYEVRFNGNQKGYVWGGKIAKTSFRSTKNPDIVFHFGLDMVKREDENDESYYQIRIEQKGKQLQKMSVKGFGYVMKMHELKNLGNKGLTNVDDVIYLEGYSEACGDIGGSVALMHTNGKLTEAIRLSSYADVPVFSNDILFFPADMKGERDRIIFYHETGEYIESEDPDVLDTIEYSEQKKLTYKWEGDKLVELKQRSSAKP